MARMFTWRARFIVVACTWVGALVFGGIGYLIGKAIGNAQIGLFVGIFLSIIPVQFVIVRLVKRDANMMQKKQ